MKPKSLTLSKLIPGLNLTMLVLFSILRVLDAWSRARTRRKCHQLPGNPTIRSALSLQGLVTRRIMAPSQYYWTLWRTNYSVQPWWLLAETAGWGCLVNICTDIVFESPSSSPSMKQGSKEYFRRFSVCYAHFVTMFMVSLCPNFFPASASIFYVWRSSVTLTGQSQYSNQLSWRESAYLISDN